MNTAFILRVAERIEASDRFNMRLANTCLIGHSCSALERAFLLVPTLSLLARTRMGLDKETFWALCYPMRYPIDWRGASAYDYRDGSITAKHAASALRYLVFAGKVDYPASAPTAVNDRREVIVPKERALEPA